MKLLTLNTHSLMESEYEKKLDIFVNAISKHMPDVVALQEVMQPIENKSVQNEYLGSIPLKEGNHGLNVVKRLKLSGVNYFLYWLGIKRSYDRFDEGVAILSKKPAKEVDIITLSPFDSYEDWKTRKALGIKINESWFYSVHMGWWNDEKSPFQYEFNELIKSLPQYERIWLMGDFNSVASERDKGYDLALKSGLFDTYSLAVNKDSGITARTEIDGWKSGERDKEIRIDYIFTNYQEEIDSSFTIFNGENEQVVSDHFGIIVTTGREEK